MGNGTPKKKTGGVQYKQKFKQSWLKLPDLKEWLVEKKTIKVKVLLTVVNAISPLHQIKFMISRDMEYLKGIKKCDTF